MADEPRLPDIAVLGAGSMGRAILGGLLSPEARHGALRITTRSAATAATVADELGVPASASDDDPEANRRAVEGAGIVLVAVKPAGILAMLREVADSLEPGALVVSVAAGITTAAMEAELRQEAVVVRAMPNTPAFVRMGVTGLSAGSRAQRGDLARARALFEPVGEVVEVPESQLDALSTVSGSGPAYVFYLAEQLAEAARTLGFSPEQAERLVGGTFRGASELLVSSGRSPGELRRQVTSPHGTTERAVEVLQDAGLGDVFERATAAALVRARELAAG